MRQLHNTMNHGALVSQRLHTAAKACTRTWSEDAYDASAAASDDQARRDAAAQIAATWND